MHNDKTNNFSSFTPDTCHLLKDEYSPFILLLGAGDNIFRALTQCAVSTGIKSASISGLGSIENVKIGYYLHEKKQHITKLFSGIYEIAALNGNITYANNSPFIHLHAGISGEDFHVYGGHIIDADAGPATELMIFPFKETIHRKFNAELGIYSICTPLNI